MSEGCILYREAQKKGDRVILSTGYDPITGRDLTDTALVTGRKKNAEIINSTSHCKIVNEKRGVCKACGLHIKLERLVT